MNYSRLLEEVKEELNGFFHSHQQEGFIYHNLDHTKSVVSHAGELARYHKLDQRQHFIVVTAAWFHDTGYYLGEANGHERKGADFASDFLTRKGLDEELIRKVRECILATCMPQSPRDLLERIVSDADLYHWGTRQFEDFNRKMRREAEWRSGQQISKTEWRNDTIHLLESHRFQTEYGRLYLEPVKQKNIERLKRKQQSHKPEEAAPVSKLPDLGIAAVSEAATVRETGKKPKTERPDRGIETMFRISSNNHQRLSDMADNKANIMITTTSIILSVLLSILLRKLEDNPHLILPTLMLLLICVVTLVFSILATRPSLPAGRFTARNIEDKQVNLLFFGNFYRMEYPEYEKGMQEMMKDRDFLYGSLTRDVYSQGVVLGRKYRLLRIAYNVFMFGVIASVLAFIAAVVIFGH